MNSRLKKAVKSLMKLLAPVNELVPKKGSRILIYSNLGFRDNVRSMYDYLVENGYNKKYEIICSLDDCSRYRRHAPENVRFVGCVHGFALFFTSRYVFYSFGKYPVKPSAGQTVINLWHGMPLKAVGNMEKGHEKDDQLFFDYTIATSELFAGIMSRSFSCDESCVIVCGQPRCDTLVGCRQRPERLIVWLPTFRSSERLGSCDGQMSRGFPLVRNREQLQRLNSLLAEYGYKLIIKPHPMQDISTAIGKLSNIALLSQNAVDKRYGGIYELFKRSSALITDYSSVSFDYLLLDRPICYAVPDMKSYSCGRGFSVSNPRELMGGAIVSSFEELLSFVEDVCRGIDNYAGRRAEVNRLVNSGQRKDSAKVILETAGVRR